MKTHPPGTRIAGQYEIAGRPLMGGMGIVYFCLDHQEDRPVALKTFHPEFLPDRAARDRFLREGTHWVNLGAHPHIVRCYRVFSPAVSSEVYLVLELVDKEQGREDASLRSWITLGRPLPVETALLFALQIARGMAHATQVIPGFVHRDLKPENVLVGVDKLPGTSVNRLRVTDFGLAAVLEAAGPRVSEGVSQPKTETVGNSHRTLLTAAGAVGTPEYMAPEQWEQRKVGLQADVYALGCILLEMLSGQMPVKAKPRSACRELHQSGQALHKASKMQGLPDAVASVLLQCLVVDPAKRYRQWADVEAALAAAFETVTGRSAPPIPGAVALSRVERIQVGWSYRAIGASYRDIGKYDVAIKYSDHVVQIGQAEKDSRLEAAGYSGLGVAYRELGDVRRAVQLFEQWLTIARETGDQTAEGYALGCLGTAFRSLGDTQKAIELQERCLTIFQEVEDQIGKCSALGDLGNVYLSLGDLQQAIRLFEQWLASTREIGDQRGMGQALGSLGHTYRLLGNPRQAIRYCQESLVIMRKIGNRAEEGMTLGHLGSAYADLGDARRAIEYFKQDLAIAQEVGKRTEEGIALGNLGVMYAKLGNIQRAIEFFEQALAIASEVRNRREEANTLGNLALAYANLGDPTRAIQLYEQSLAIAQKIEDRMAAASTSLNFALLLTKQGQWANALRHAQFAAAVFKQLNHQPMLRKVHQLLNTLRVIQSNPADAQASYNRGNVYLSLNHNDEAMEDFRRAIRLDPSYAPAHLNIGTLLANRGKLQEALPHLDRAAQLGIPQGAHLASQIRQRLQGIPASQTNPGQLAFEAFQRADSPNGMQHAVTQFPFMTTPGFIAAIEKAIAQQVPQNLKAAFKQRLVWLRQITDQQE
jgi:tetratricopeptide (TPR) repeat protein